MKNFKKAAITLLLLIAGAAFGSSDNNADYRVDFDNFILLESERSEGKHLDITKDTPDTILYSGGQLPVNPEIKNKMYTFKKDFSLDNKHKNTDLALYIGLFEYPFKIYLNGKEIYKKGRYKGKRYNSSLRLVSYLYLTPDHLNFDSQNTIVIQAYPKFETWALDTIYIDKMENISKAVFLRNFIGVNLLQAAFILSLATGLYFLVFSFVTDDKSRKYLYFSIFSFIFCAAYFNVVIHHESMNEIFFEALSKSSMILMSTSIVLFIGEFTHILQKNKYFYKILTAISFAAFIFVFIQPTKESLLATFGQTLNFLIMPQLLFCIAAIIIYKIKGTGDFFLTLVFSFSILFFTVFHDAYYFITMTLPYAWLMTYGFFALVIGIFSILVIEQSRLFQKTKKQAEDLRVNKIEIEALNKELTLQKDSFFRFVPTEFLQLLGKDSAVDITLGDSSLRLLSVLFSDIRRYTGLCENMLPDKNFEFLNNYLMSMQDSIYQNNGFIDKYIGDAIMALFTDNSEEIETSLQDAENIIGQMKSESAKGSLNAALHMEQGLVDFNKHLKTNNYDPIDIGIGVNTGPAVLGTVGSTVRLDTTVIGDTVNIASRLENLTKIYKTRILVSESTVKSLPENHNFVLRNIDNVVVAGATKPMKLYELLNMDDPKNKLKQDNISKLENGIKLYCNKNFSKAVDIFNSIAASDPRDKVAKLYQKRCQVYMKKPPKSDWNGIFYPPK